MEKFNYYNPVKVVFGEDSIKEVGSNVALYGKRALLVSYQNVSFFQKTIDTIHQELKENGVECVDCFIITANPLMSQARTGVELCLKHNLDVIKTADYIIDMGPEGGDEGGTIIANGTPEEVAKVNDSFTGQFIKRILQNDKR